MAQKVHRRIEINMHDLTSIGLFLLLLTFLGLFFYRLLRKEEFLFNFKIGRSSLAVNIFPFITLNFPFSEFEKVEMVTFGRAFAATIRFNSRMMNNMIFIKRRNGFIRDFAIGPENPEKFLADLKRAIEESEK